MPCDVCECLASVSPRLQDPELPSHYLLVGGKVEKQLKYFVGATWQAMGQGRAYVMDKRFARELDLLAFENLRPRFWMELKCSFREDPTDSLHSATRALIQTQQIVAALDPRLSQCPGFIIHFVNSIPDHRDPHLPDWVLDKFAGLRISVPVRTTDLVDVYTSAGHRLHAVIPISDSPHVEAVVIEVVQPNLGFLDCDKQHARERAA